EMCIRDSAIVSLKSKAKKFDGLVVGLRPSEEKIALKIKPLRCFKTIEWVGYTANRFVPG
ncbi:MAG: hypothetical protein WB697_23430, partial [Stellaceae bacterium]